LEGFGIASEAGARHFVAVFRLLLEESKLGQTRDTCVDYTLLRSERHQPSLSLFGANALLVGKALLLDESRRRGAKHVARAKRVLHFAGDRPTQVEAAATAEDIAIGGLGANPDADRDSLDAAVALFELAGHPHILAREAYALVQDAGCAEAMALVAAGPAGRRVVEAHGWTEAAALAAAAGAAADDLVPLGRHRDETWQLLARPKPGLDDRCTLAAVTKLIAAARALDAYRRDEKQRAALWPAEALDGDADSLWISEQSAELLAIARRIANAPLPVLLTGETGTGKEMLARAIHRASTRADAPLHPFNCTAVPRDMLESQLFGYRKGAFTGADAGFPGVLRAAAGGTLFLDEIGDIGLDVQPKLLRFLERHEIHPLGEPHPITVDVRVIAATNANLDRLVAEGRFREDLLYRLNVMTLHLPPLRERREEIPPLVQHYIRRYADEQGKGSPALADDTLEYLLLYPWPGNIRQLANEVRRMIALAEPDATLTPALLSPDIQASRRTLPAPATAEAEIRLRLDQRLPEAVDALEQSLVRRALERSHGRVEEAARLLGISRKGLFLKRRRWGMRAES
jgi:DNA-binding NtrC family response regulator